MTLDIDILTNRIEQLEQAHAALKLDHGQLGDDFADLCDELQTDLSKVRAYRQRQRLLHRFVCEVMGLASELELIVAREPGKKPAGRGPRDIVKNPPRAARYIIIYLLRLTDREVATARRLNRDYGVYVEDRSVTEAVTELLVRGNYRKKYQQICARYAAAVGLPAGWCPEPSYYLLKKAALDQVGVGAAGRTPQSFDD